MTLQFPLFAAIKASVARGARLRPQDFTKRDRLVMGFRIWRFGLLCHPQSRSLTGAG
jgi:hypothetical protein